MAVGGAAAPTCIAGAHWFSFGVRRTAQARYFLKVSITFCALSGVRMYGLVDMLREEHGCRRRRAERASMVESCDDLRPSSTLLDSLPRMKGDATSAGSKRRSPSGNNSCL